VNFCQKLVYLKPLYNLNGYFYVTVIIPHYYNTKLHYLQLTLSIFKIIAVPQGAYSYVAKHETPTLSDRISL
jgi:hypothetical protein